MLRSDSNPKGTTPVVLVLLQNVSQTAFPDTVDRLSLDRTKLGNFMRHRPTNMKNGLDAILYLEFVSGLET